ncbi:MAG: hypothetical protein WBV94_20830 [Blastocatellia bacterium]
MREKSQLRRTGNNPALPTRLTDQPASGGSFRWRRMKAAWRERLSLIFHPYKKVQESTMAEIASIEARVRKELYP